MAAEIRLIATDLDGTLIGSANELPFYTDFAEQLTSLRARSGAVWVACTGRKYSSFQDFFSPMRRMGLLPDYVIVRHAYIFKRTWLGFMPHVVWNVSILLRIWREGQAASAAIDRWHETLIAGATGVSTVRRSPRRLGLRFESEESAATAADLLRREVQAYAHLRIFCYGCHLEVRTVPATKGVALSELANCLNIEREHVLAIGNGANDLSMLNGQVAGMVGCPSNSEPEVMQVVNRVGGHIAGQRALRGVMEVLEAFSQASVRSDLPSNFQPAAEPAHPTRIRQAKASAGRHHRRSHPLMLGAIVYAGLLVFASFDVLPYVSVWVRKPLDLLVALFVRIYAVF